MEARWSSGSSGITVGCLRHSFGRCLRASVAKRPMALQEALELVGAELFEELAKAQTPALVDVSEDVTACLGGMDQHDPTILVLVPSLDEAALLHPVDDPGHARHGDVERLGQVAHGVRAVRVEHGEHVQVNEAERAVVPAAKGADELARVPRQEFVPDGVGEPPPTRYGRVRRGFRGRGVDIQ